MSERTRVIAVTLDYNKELLLPVTTDGFELAEYLASEAMICDVDYDGNAIPNECRPSWIVKEVITDEAHVMGVLKQRAQDAQTKQYKAEGATRSVQARRDELATLIREVEPTAIPTIRGMSERSKVRALTGALREANETIDRLKSSAFPDAFASTPMKKEDSKS